MRSTPARAAACAKVEAAATLAPVIVGAFADSVHEVERRAATVERARARGGIRHVALDPVEPGRRARARAAFRVRQRTCQPARASAGLTAPPTKPVAPVRSSVRAEVDTIPLWEI